ncbi:unnamed protein product [Hymenolepis diminuta]|uniref:Coiled-coil domain-containing protein 181 n=1 Tax=Hymenolepis diminuta TaxID=6216 RepID=A0A564Z1J2_HYMDI|nr:unnamed protein product [Hymenolepis diminuta]
MALGSVFKSFDDLHGSHSNNSSQINPNSSLHNSRNISSEEILKRFNDFPKQGKFDGESIVEQRKHESSEKNDYSPYHVSSDNRAKEIFKNATLIQDNPIPSKPPPAYSRKIFSSNDSEVENLTNDFREFTKYYGNDTSYNSKQFDGKVKSNENVMNSNDSLNGDKNRSSEVKAKTQNTNIRVQSAATPVIRSGAMRGSRSTLNVVTLSTSIQNPSSQSSLLKPPLPNSASLRNNIVNENKGENSFREIPLRRVQSSMELRNLTFQTWCERRGKQYLKEKRLEQLKRLQEEEEAKKLKAEKSRQNEEVFAMWLAKKQQQALEAKKKRLKEKEEQRETEESKKQLKAEAEKAFEAWKSKKEKQRERRHSISYVNREKAAEELRAKLEKSIAAHHAYEAWQKQVNQRLQEIRERESKKIREEENRKSEMEAMRKELARTSYTQWELRKVCQNSHPVNRYLILS